jgi:hypothetical protein
MRTLEHFAITLTIPATVSGNVRYAAYLLGEKSAGQEPMTSHKLSIERVAALRSSALRFDKN